MKQVSFSFDTYGEIWKRAKEGESEEDVVRRIMGLLPLEAGSAAAAVDAGSGFYDKRNGVHFKQNFVIGRSYKGNDYQARAVDGKWEMHGKRYDSINALNVALGAMSENAWISWYFERSPDNWVQIDELRPK
jgi:hypothetical protein